MVWVWWKQKVLRKGGKNTQNDYKKDLSNPDIPESVITHLEPDILEDKVKWACGILFPK